MPTGEEIEPTRAEVAEALRQIEQATRANFNGGASSESKQSTGRQSVSRAPRPQWKAPTDGEDPDQAQNLWGV